MRKILIIGAGPGGLYAAIEARQKGLDVTLVDKGKVGENICCAEGFFDALKILGKPCAGVTYKVKELIIGAKNTYRFNVESLYIWMTDRKKWQVELAKDARNQGVIIKEDCPISYKELRKLKDQFDYIIDASGVPSVTSRAYNFAGFYKQHSGKTVQYVMEGDFSHLKDCFKVGILPGLWGYYWIFPKGKTCGDKELANVGIGYFGNEHCNLKLSSMLNEVIFKENLAGYKIVKKMGGMCPSKMLDRLVYDNILLIGDAAGLTSPLHGGGIDMAILSGKKAVEAISKGDINSYERKLKDILSLRLQFDEAISKAWSKMSFERVDRVLSKLNNLGLYRLLYNPVFIKPITAKILES